MLLIFCGFLFIFTFEFNTPFLIKISKWISMYSFIFIYLTPNFLMIVFMKCYQIIPSQIVLNILTRCNLEHFLYTETG